MASWIKELGYNPKLHALTFDPSKIGVYIFSKIFQNVPWGFIFIVYEFGYGVMISFGDTYKLER